jgi:MerR family mercuric resistance operon transcriptional regulator
MGQESFTIGTLAKKAGVNVETIRFYQRRRLLIEPERPLRGVRRYTEHDARRVRLIKQIQKIGFSLDEIAELLGIEDERHCPRVRDIVLAKLASIRARIEDLRTIEKNLSDLAESCLGNADGACCPAISALQEKAAS